MKAIIEIGSNSLKLLIYRTKPSFQVVLDETKITRLSQEYNLTGKISPLALNRNIQEIHRCQDIIKKYECSDVSLYGTMIFRSAKNSREVLAQILQQTGLNLHILSGQEEATYSFYAAIHDIQIKDMQVMVIDTGGGSTEFIFGRAGAIDFAESLDVGAVTLTDRFNLKNEVETSVLEEVKEYLANKFNNINVKANLGAIIGIGGTVTTISAIIQKLEDYSADKIQGSIINLNDIIELEKELATKNLAKRKNIIGLSPKRADIILGGVLIIRSILEKYEKTEMIVCDHGLRYGLALKEWRKK